MLCGWCEGSMPGHGADGSDAVLARQAPVRGVENTEFTAACAVSCAVQLCACLTHTWFLEGQVCCRTKYVR